MEEINKGKHEYCYLFKSLFEATDRRSTRNSKGIVNLHCGFTEHLAKLSTRVKYLNKRWTNCCEIWC